MKTLNQYRHRKDGKHTLLVIVFSFTAAILSALVSGFYFHSNMEPLAQALSDAEQRNEWLSDDNKKLASYQKRLADEFVDQKQQLAIQNATNAELKKQIQQIQDQVVDLNEELLFYHTVTQGSASHKLQIRDFRLQQDTNKQIVHYRAVISQGKKLSEAIKGSIQISVNNASKKRILNQHQLNLRYVQILEGTIELSGEIKPNGVTIVVKPDGKKSLSKTFNWQIDKV